MDKIRYSVRFNRKNKLNKQGLAPVQIECLLNRKRRFFDTKIKVSPNDWDNTQKRVKNTHPNAIKLNQRISQIITEYIQRQSVRYYKKTLGFNPPPVFPVSH